MAHRFVVGKSSDLRGSSVRGSWTTRPTLDEDSHHRAVPGAGPGSSGKRLHEDIDSFQHAGRPKAQTSKRSRQALSGSIGLAQQPTPMDSHISLQVSKAITGFARYPHKRPRGLHSDLDGSLDIDEIWQHWGRLHGVSKHHMLQFISEHAFSSDGRRRFLLRAVIPRAGPGCRSRKVCGASPNLAVHVVASVHREHWLQTRGAAMATFSRSLLGTLRRTTLRSPSSTRS